MNSNYLNLMHKRIHESIFFSFFPFFFEFSVRCAFVFYFETYSLSCHIFCSFCFRFGCGWFFYLLNQMFYLQLFEHVPWSPSVKLDVWWHFTVNAQRMLLFSEVHSWLPSESAPEKSPSFIIALEVIVFFSVTIIIFTEASCYFIITPSFTRYLI